MLPTPEFLENVALRYLSRFASSEENLRRVLENHIKKAAMSNREFSQDLEAQRKLRIAIDSIIEKHKKSGALNDFAYAVMKIDSMRREGKSRKRIEEKLKQKGIPQSIITSILSEKGGNEEELKAALVSIKKIKRKTNKQSEKKLLSAMARAGFSYEIAKKALKAAEKEN